MAGVITVTAAKAADRLDCLRLVMAQLSEHEIALGGERVAAALDGALADPSRGVALIAREAEAAVGVAYVSFVWTMEHGGLSAWLEELYVIPARRGRGIGARLLDEAVALARARGCAAIDLEVEARHARAANLYARAGFRAHSRARWVRADLIGSNPT